MSRQSTRRASDFETSKQLGCLAKDLQPGGVPLELFVQSFQATYPGQHVPDADTIERYSIGLAG